MANKTVYPFGTNGESTGGISKVVEYDCKAEMFLDNTKPIGTIAKVTDVYRYKKGENINGETVYGIMIQEGSLPTSGTCLVSTTDNNSIFFSNYYGYLEIRDVFGVYEELDSSNTYLLSGDIYNLIKDGNFIGSSSAPDYDTVRYKIKKGTGRITYYVYNGHGWNVLKNTDLTKPQKLRVVHHCIPFGAKPGLLYVGKSLKNGTMFNRIGNIGNCVPAMSFKHVAGKTIDLSKLGILHFVVSNETSNYYTIDTTTQTITFTNNCGNPCWAILKSPSSDSGNTRYCRKRFGYYIDDNGKLTLYVDNPDIEIEEHKLPPIEIPLEFINSIIFIPRPRHFKGNTIVSGESYSHLCIKPYNNIDLEVLETGCLKKRFNKHQLRRATKWIRARRWYVRHGGLGKGNSKRLVQEQGWNLLRLQRCGRILYGNYYYSGHYGIFRIRRTNRLKTRFSEWTYWKLFCISNGVIEQGINQGLPNIVTKCAYRLKEIYHKQLNR